MSHMSWFGKKVFDTIEYVGEGVVSVLGLDDSRYQDVLDNMTEDEMARAQQVNAEREVESRLRQMMLEAQEEGKTADVEQDGASMTVVNTEEVEESVTVPVVDAVVIAEEPQQSAGEEQAGLCTSEIVPEVV